MKITNLEKELNDGRNEFIGETIQISGNGIFLNENSLLFINNLSFHDCVFKGSHLEIEDINLPDFYLGFFNCHFEISLDIKNCNFKRLGFRDIKSNKPIYISEGHYKNFFFRNNSLKEKEENQLSINLSICNLTVTERIELDYLNFIDGEFNFSNNILSNLDSEFKDKIIIFENSTFYNAKFLENRFLTPTSFEEMEIIKNCLFESCEFQRVNFNNLDLGTINFLDCSFLDVFTLHYAQGDLLSFIKFENCNFDKTVQFNRTASAKFEMDNIQFKNIVSFQDSYFELIKIDRSIFEKKAFFDDIKIKKIDQCDRRTIITIKQELQKAENKIDYNRFRVYEFNAYKKDIQKKLLEFKNDKHRFNHRKREPIQLKRDLFVLNISDIVSEYGTDWKRAFKFTLLSGLTAFTLFFVFENLDKSFNLNNWQDFIYGYLRFFLITDFKNEYYDTGESILKFNCFLSLIPFILGKIAVAFGIYEMIQSFRKFKA